MSQRIKMSERQPDIRNKDFQQVNLGYTDEQALQEAKRCLQCKKPLCVTGCPVEINIPGFIKQIAEKNPNQAFKVLKEKNNLPAVCGRVCPQESQCEKHCILGIKQEPVAIGNLERYTADWAANNIKISEIKIEGSRCIRVAVIGSGPAGLTCAGDLAKLGYDVTVFESLHDSGGVLRYGIPEFRLPSNVLDREVDSLKALGIKFIFNYLIGRTKTVADLFNDGFKAIFVGTGAGLPTFPGIEGENFNNIYSANEFLVRINLMTAFKFPEFDTPIYKGKNVVVIGGGNTAMDSVRTAKRIGAESVKLVYRRTQEEMPARLEERHHALQEGVEFVELTAPVKFLADEKGFVKAVECIKMELTEPDASGRRKPVPIPNSNFIIETDLVILALGLHPNPILPSLTKGLETNAKGYLIINDNFMTTINGIFAGGDIAGGSTVIQAMGMGKQAAKNIHLYLSK
ncbi:MAG: NADPH-dependent glutamate synthase [Endomicrobiaceae bacterium]|nr:NADPH-dependent glutamate synthase [Endomicrobiaceae bacterium]MDD3054110.1 NADPH-dependent glutamate synthase [Endomicrobiaceae bacterium]